MRFLPVLCLLALISGCDDTRDPVDGGGATDAGPLPPGVDGGPGFDAGDTDTDAGPGGSDAGAGTDAGGGGGGLTSTLTITCNGQLQGRAIVNYNSNLGIAFTDGAPAFTPRGSISFDFPSGFSGTIDNPEIVGDGPRHTLAITTSDFTTYGNHCWPFGTAPRGGSATIQEWRPNDGVVRATFSGVPLNNCVTMSDSCQLDGTIETTGEGVFE